LGGAFALLLMIAAIGISIWALSGVVYWFTRLDANLASPLVLKSLPE
jgi:hypothetical protein